MESLEKGKIKLTEICDLLRKETLEPAQSEASKIIEDAKKQAEGILEKAKKDAEQVINEAQAKIAQERKLFENSMDLASKQTFEQLQEKICDHFFATEMHDLSEEIFERTEWVEKIVAATIEAVEKSNLSENIVLELSKSLDAKKIASHLVDHLAEKISQEKVSLESTLDGAVIKLVDHQMRIEISKESLRGLMGQFLKDAFREVLYKNS